MSGFQIFVKNFQLRAKAESPLNLKAHHYTAVIYIRLPRVKLQSVVIPGLPEVAVDAKHLLELVNGSDVADCQVEDNLYRLPRDVLWSHLPVVTLFHQQVVKCVGNLKSE